MRTAIIGTDNSEYPSFSFQCRKAFEKLGFETKYFNYRYLKLHKTKFTNSILNKSIIKKVLDYNPDILFVNKGETILPNVIKKISSSGIKTLNWIIDEPFGKFYKNNKINNIDEYDYFFVFDPYYLDDLKKINQNSYYLPCAADPENVHIEVMPFDKRNYISEVSFIGSHEKKRENLLRNLTNYNLNVWGYRWKYIQDKKLINNVRNNIPKGKEMCKLFNLSKVNLNIHALHSINGVNLRTFEILATKSFMLCDYFSEIPKLFRMNKEIVCYNNLNDLKHKIDYYLANEKERNKISLAGYKRVLKEHTVLHRIKTIISKIK